MVLHFLHQAVGNLAPLNTNAIIAAGNALRGNNNEIRLGVYSLGLPRAEGLRFLYAFQPTPVTPRDTQFRFLVDHYLQSDTYGTINFAATAQNLAVDLTRILQGQTGGLQGRLRDYRNECHEHGACHMRGNVTPAHTNYLH